MLNFKYMRYARLPVMSLRTPKAGTKEVITERH